MRNTRLLTALVVGGGAAWSVMAPGSGLAADAVNVRINQIDAAAFPEMTLYVTVTDADGRPVNGLAAERFVVLEDGLSVAGHVVNPVAMAREPLALALAVDVSSSMAGNALAEAQAAGTAFVDGLGADDRVALLSFGSEVLEVQPLTADKAAVRTAIAALTAGGNTALYEAMFRAAEVVAPEPGRKAIVVLTDGWNYRGPARTLDEALERAAAAGAPAFALGFGSAHEPPLRDLAAVTGGVYMYRLAADRVGEMFDLLGGQLQSQYVVTYLSSVTPDGLEHDVAVEVTTDAGVGRDARNFLAIPSGPLPTPVPTVVTPPGVTAAAPAPTGVVEAVTDPPAGAAAWLLAAFLGLMALLGVRAVAVALRARDRPGVATETVTQLPDAGFDEPTGAHDPLLAGVAPMPVQPQAVSEETHPTQVIDRAPEPLAWLVVLDGSLRGRDFRLAADETLIGRAEECAIVLDSETVSRLHAKLRRDGEDYWLHDLGGVNPTTVNGEEVLRHKLSDGDRIGVGDIRLVFKRVV